jgi:hypothetical protein
MMITKEMIVTKEMRRTMMMTMMGLMIIHTRWILRAAKVKTIMDQSWVQPRRRVWTGVPNRGNQGLGELTPVMMMIRTVSRNISG